MDVQESAGDMKNEQDQEPVADTHGTHPPKLYQGPGSVKHLSVYLVCLHFTQHKYRRKRVIEMLKVFKLNVTQFR